MSQMLSDLVCHCLRCGHIWTPRRFTQQQGKLVVTRPKVCPKCKSVNWDKPRVANPQGKVA